MSTFNRRNFDDFQGQIKSKGKRYIPDPEKDILICDNCINKELMEAKKKRDLEMQKMETPIEIQDRLNALTQDKIQNKVNDRIKRSEQVAKKMRSISQEKEKLIKENEKGTFFLNDPNVLSNDYMRKRAMDKYYRKQNLNRSFDNANTSEKPEVDKYYRKYVDNYKEPEPEKKRKFNTQNYNEELGKQIQQRDRLNQRKINLENQKINEELERQNRQYNKEKEEEYLKRQRMNDEFLQGNKNLMYLRSKKAQNERMEADDFDRRNVEQIQKEEQESRRKRDEEEAEKKRNLQRDLEKQVRDKMKKKALEKVKETGIIPKTNFGGCTCEGLGICAFCKKQYPLKYLNPARGYADIAKLRKKNSLRRPGSKYEK